MRRAISLWGARSFIYYLLLELLVLKAVAVFLWFILRSLPRIFATRRDDQTATAKAA
jgi:hypothetical protein